MSIFENRNGMYAEIPEYRKRKKCAFAAHLPKLKK